MTLSGSEICTLRSISLARSSRPLGVLAGDLEDLGHLVADPDRRVQRAARVLVDHRHLRGAQLAHLRLAHVREVLAGHLHRAARDARRCAAGSAARRTPRSTCRSRTRPRGRRTRPRRSAKLTPRRTWPPDAAHAVGDLQVGQLECGGRRDGAFRSCCHRSKAEATPSAIRFTPITSVAIARLGNSDGPPEAAGDHAVVLGDLQAPVRRRAAGCRSRGRRAPAAVKIA